MANDKELSTLTLKFGAFSVALGAFLAILAESIWRNNTPAVALAILFAALTLWIANSIEKELIEKYNSRN